MRDPHLYPALSMRSVLLLPVALLPPIATSMMGSYLTAGALVSWYPQLVKPFFTPPNLAFPIAWTFLFALMALAFWRILRARPEQGPRRVAIIAFMAQLVFNIGWSWAFFGQRSPIMGLVAVSLLFIAVAVTIRVFKPLDRTAAFALYPYLAWVGFAAALNAAIVVLNPAA